MISIKFNIADNELSVEVEGHAGSAEYGKDLVCASASTLLYTLAQSVTNMYQNDMLEEQPKIILKSGRGGVSCIPKMMYYGDTKSVYVFANVGYNLLAHNYPQYVEVKTNESKNNSLKKESFTYEQKRSLYVKHKPRSN